MSRNAGNFGHGAFQRQRGRIEVRPFVDRRWFEKTITLKPVVAREFPLADAAQRHRADHGAGSAGEDSAGDIAPPSAKYSNIARALALSSFSGRHFQKTVMAHRFLDDRVLCPPFQRY